MIRAGSNMVRKGAWTAEEDLLLKNCIEKFGEGKWHLVPLKAGLNRCRKSCRLRWLNYLRPNIKRGNFDEDEVDLILRLHKLLGNRWALIAGRIPGRTANDVKNYWNTHIHTRAKQRQIKGKSKDIDDEQSQDTMVTIIKPLPRTLTKTLNQFVHDDQEIAAQNTGDDLITTPDDGRDKGFSLSPSVISPRALLEDKINEYWNELFDEPENEIIEGETGGWSFGGSSVEEEEALNVGEQEEGQNSLFHFPVDDVTWDF